MIQINLISYLLISLLSLSSCETKPTVSEKQIILSESKPISIGAEQYSEYIPFLKNKKVALVVNQTSLVNNQHLVDDLLSKNIDVVKVFAPEHGFRGTADAGETIKNNIDSKSGLPVISLYGKNKKPTSTQLLNIDVVIFDIQDVGARFYTYISTLEYVMEACAEENKQVIVLDRPNPNGHYIDGPILKKEFQSFVGRQEIPIVHGLTVAEYAQYLNGEKLLKNGIQANLVTVKCQNYSHDIPYTLPVAPSPNLPNQKSIILYPSLCLFEGTNVSVGRGTSTQFQVFGSPEYTIGSFAFTPKPMPGAKYPKLNGIPCFGFNLTTIDNNSLFNEKQLNINWLIDMYNFHQSKGKEFFLKNGFFDKLAGSDQLRKQIEVGISEEAIRMSWQDEIKEYKIKRKKYLLYPDFE